MNRDVFCSLQKAASPLSCVINSTLMFILWSVCAVGGGAQGGRGGGGEGGGGGGGT